MNKKIFIVWNQAKTEGFTTDDEQLAYEVRKSADSNCYRGDGLYSEVAAAFCNRWVNDICTIQEIRLEE